MPDNTNDPCLNINCGYCLELPCAICGDTYGDHFTTNNGKYSGCDAINPLDHRPCLCDGFEPKENAGDAACYGG